MPQNTETPMRAIVISTMADHARLLEHSLGALDGWDWVRVSRASEAAALFRLDAFTVAIVDADSAGWDEDAYAFLRRVSGSSPMILLGHGARPEGKAEAWLDWDHFSRAKLAASLAAVAGWSGEVASSKPAWDAVTGLPASRMFLEQARQACALARRQRTGIAALVIRFEGSPNGWEGSFKWRRESALRMRACLRESDLLGQTGEGEVAMLLGGLTRAEELAALGRRILEALRSVAETNPGAPVPSAGAAMMPAAYGTADSLLDAARRGVTRSRALGGDCLHFDDTRLDDASVERFRYEVDLRNGLLAGQFTLHLQPQARLDGKVVGGEALLRWLHPEKGPVPPSEFIPFSESCGFIDALSDWALRRALKASAGLEALCPGFRIGVNLSPRQFRDPGLVDQILEALHQADCPGSRLCLEVTESSALDDFDEAARILGELREAGIQVALDDFGSGYASVGYLKRLPLDLVKLDRSLVQELGRKKEDERIAELVIAIAHKLNLTVVAEGVETQIQWESLKKMGCDQFQGYILAKPQPLEGFEEWLKAGVPQAFHSVVSQL